MTKPSNSFHKRPYAWRSMTGPQKRTVSRHSWIRHRVDSFLARTRKEDAHVSDFALIVTDGDIVASIPGKTPTPMIASEIPLPRVTIKSSIVPTCSFVSWKTSLSRLTLRPQPFPSTFPALPGPSPHPPNTLQFRSPPSTFLLSQNPPRIQRYPFISAR